MRNRSKLILSAFTSALILAGAVGTASANNLSINEQSFRTIWTPLVLSNGPGGGGEIQIECNVTLEGSFHSHTIAKVIGTLLGFITRAIVDHNSCNGGDAWALTEEETGNETLPWHVTYEGFGGTLPNITSVRLLLTTHFSSEPGLFGITCLYSGNASGDVTLDARSGNASAVIPDDTIGLPKEEGSFLCPGEGYFHAEPEASSVSGLATETLTVTLI